MTWLIQCTPAHQVFAGQFLSRMISERAGDKTLIQIDALLTVAVLADYVRIAPLATPGNINGVIGLFPAL